MKMPSNEPRSAERKRCACLADLKRRIFFSRRRVGWCEFSARLFKTRVLTVLPALQDFALRRAIALQLISDDDARNVVQPYAQRGAKKRLAAFAVRVGSATRMSRTLPSWSTARHRECLWPRIVRKISSRCHVSPQRGRRRRSSLVYVCPNAQTPLPHRFIAHDDPALCQKLFNRTEN